MEISSTFPFVNQDEFSHFFNWVQDMEGAASGLNNGDTEDIINSRKRVKREDNNNNNNPYYYNNNNNTNNNNEKTMKKDQITTSLILLDEEEKQENKHWAIESEQELGFMDSNFNQQSKAMTDYYNNQIVSHYSDLNELHQSQRAKRRRSSTTALLSSAVVPTTTTTNNSNFVDFGSGSGQAQQQQQQQPPQPQTHQRRLWVKDRSKDWWEKCNHPDFPEDEFKKAFRMSKATLDLICEELDSVVTKKNTMLRDAIPVRQRVAVCIWRLATGEPLRLVSKRFGLGISTCHKLVLEVCSAIKTVLMKKYVQWPDEENMEGIKQGFESVSGIPNVGGSMYTTHVPIIAPKISVAAYFNKRHTERNQKTSYSITVQGVVDPRGVFTDLCIGWPGSMLDDQVLEKSALHERANRGSLKDIWIVGNSSYPLMDWVMIELLMSR
ncbi:hypothetical protein ACFE04_018386 [Oxalis oulophora]